MSDPIEKTAVEWKEQGNILFKNQQFKQAVELYTKAIELEANATFYSNRAAAHLNDNQFKLSLQDCLTASSLDPTMIKAFFRAARCQMHLGNLDEAMLNLKQLESMALKTLVHKKEIKKEMLEITLLKSKLAEYTEKMAGENFNMALHDIETVMIILDPKLSGSGLQNSISRVDTNQCKKIPVKWSLLRAETLLSLWDANEAGQVARMILRSDSRNCEAIYLVAKSMYMLESHSIATINQYLSTALNYDPDNKNARTLFKLIKKLEALKNSGNDAYKCGDWAGALMIYDEFLLLNQTGAITKAKVLSNRAIVSSKMERYSEVIQDCEDAISIVDRINFPKDFLSEEPISNEDRSQCAHQALYSKLILRRADAYTKTERFEEAVRDYETAAALEDSRGIYVSLICRDSGCNPTSKKTSSNVEEERLLQSFGSREKCHSL